MLCVKLHSFTEIQAENSFPDISSTVCELSSKISKHFATLCLSTEWNHYISTNHILSTNTVYCTDGEVNKMDNVRSTRYVCWPIDWQCLTFRPTQYRLYGRQFYRSKDPTNSIKLLKEKTLQKKPRKCKQHKIQQYSNTIKRHILNPLVYT